jgi:SpoVK/Ycf46/Vps4 family AAA+-type ATPase
LDFGKGEAVLLDDLIRSYLDGTATCRNGEALLACTNDYLEWIISDAVRQKENARFSDLNKVVDSMTIKLDGITVRGFSYHGMDKAEACVMSVKREDYVGNEEFLDFLGKSFKSLLDYDLKEKKNPHLVLDGFKQTLTAWGEPGTGKTLGISLAYNEAQEIAKKFGIPMYFRELRGFKSQYFGESAKNIRNMFEETKKGDGVYVIVAEDIDTIFFSRENTKDRQEDADIMGEFMNQLEGVTANHLGNYLLIATSNHPLQGDGALMDRLKQGQIEVKRPQNPAQYSAVFKAKLRVAVNNRYAAVRDWNSIGASAYKHALSNRDIRNICLDVLDKTKNYSRTPDFYSLSFADRVKYLSSNRKCIGDNEILGAINDYAAQIEEQKNKDFDSAVQRQVDQYMIEKEVANRVRVL